ncbi:Cleavage and polyadenylation specificity factor 30 kDa subunit, putative [Perkinsus marinus ATCC 50983]|nr:Cleavage and polyadenylation specificity factor 30 kDa subunit, putative [Perkinsus marinus ATCC 50983]EER20144.1 Cleavage and polyadenylation specificity factor 30 kDa subunit, putative [Perkinsus marinus ATCC 50983]|eukprot:XP_002788348.1 Cleavage and polyadenylation specificity factor 30 kDa subunit, putative [Perkinsus marinus ATCC 50983]
MCRNGTSCPFRHDPKSIICTYYLHGNCRNGISCRFSHELPDTQQPAVEEGVDGPPPDVCKFFWHGSCRAGSSCRWRHVKAPSRLSAAPPPNLPAKSNPLVSERAKALLERHSISRIAQESGASEIVVKARAPATKSQR